MPAVRAFDNVVGRRNAYQFIRPRSSIKREVLAQRRSANVSNDPTDGVKYPAILRRSFRLRSSGRKAKGEQKDFTNASPNNSWSSGGNKGSVKHSQNHLSQQNHDFISREECHPPYPPLPPASPGCEDANFSRHFRSLSDYDRGNSFYSNPVRSRHPSGVSSSSSTQDTGQVVLPRHPRSPRKLTKDSGYETSIQGEPDYVNSDWLSEGTSTPVFGGPPPPPVHRTSSSSMRDISSYWTPSVSGDESTENQRLPTMNRRDPHNLHRSLSYIRDQFESCLDPSSSVESLSGETFLLHPTKSVSSLNAIPGDKVNPHHPLPPPYHTPWPAGPVLPSRSAPNLDQEVNMVTRTFKKRSVYETLASKSGLDFAPVIQRPPYWERREIFEEERCHQIAAPIQRRPVGDRGIESRNVVYLPPHGINGVPKGKVVPPPLPPSVSGREGQRSPSPPPVPVRSHYEEVYNKRNSIHEKYPSWPVTPGGAQTTTSSHRSNSWTEHTDYPKEKAPYSRPKNSYQISVHQLHPVQEGGVRRVPHKDEYLAPPSPGFSPSVKNLEAEFALSKSLESSLSIGFDSLYCIPYSKSSQNNKDYSIHSPPERDIPGPLAARSDTYRYEDMIRYYSHTAKFYGHWAKGGSLQTQSLSVDSTTPLLDRLRLESESLPSVWTSRMAPDLEAPSEISTCPESVESTSSSQETLKWHGSYSDLSTLSIQASNRSSQFDSGLSTLPDSGRLTPQSFCSNSTTTLMSTEGGTGAHVVAKHGLHQESVAHSSRVEPPQRHDSESVLYYAPGSKQGHTRVSRECDTRRSCGRIDLFSTNHEENIPESRHSPNQAFSASFPGFSRTVHYDSHDVRQLELHRSPASSRSTHSISKLKVSANRMSSGCRRPDVAVPNPPTMSQSGMVNRGESDACNQRLFYLDPSKRHRVSDPELKAIQKRAVLSFYHRQTSMASDSSSETRSTQVPSPTKLVSAWSHSTWDVDKSRAKVAPESSAWPIERHYEEECSSLPDFSHRNTSFRSIKSIMPSETHPASKNERLLDSGTRSIDASTLTDPVVQQQHRDHKDQSRNGGSNNKSTASFWLNKPGRKAHLKKVYNSNETAVVKLISSDGVTLVEAVEKNETKKAESKPQVPPKPAGKSTSPTTTKSDSQSLPHLPVEIPLGLDGEEDEELKRIEENTKNRSPSEYPQITRATSPISTFSQSTCSSPDLPLPPPPSTTDTEVLNPDVPLPPPPPEMTEVELVISPKEQSPLGHANNHYVSYTDEEKSGEKVYNRYPCFEPSGTHLPVGVSTVHQPSCNSPKEPICSNKNVSAEEEVIYENVYCANNSKQARLADEVLGSQTDSSLCSSATSPVASCGEHISPTSHTVFSFPKHFGCDGNRPSVSSSLSECTIDTATPSAVKIQENIYANLECRQQPALPNSVSEVKEGNNLLTNGYISGEAQPVPNLTTTATQTTDTLTFSRTQTKSREELECERLSQDFVKCYGDTFLRNLLLPAPNHKTMSDYMEGLLDLKLERVRKTTKLPSPPKAASTKETVQQPALSNGCREEVSVPPTSAYFTTSEPKAKLLTRYCQNLGRQDWTDEAELTLKKKDLIASIGRKLEILRLEQVAVKEEMAQNDQLGLEVTGRVEKLAKSNELEKYRLHIEELEKIINLLLSLSGRLARAQNALANLPKDAPAEEKCFLEAKRNKLNEQHEEARHLKESIDRRSQQVSTFLRHYLTDDEYADYDHFIMMKSKLLMDTREIDEKIKLGEEQLAALCNSLDSQVCNSMKLEVSGSTSPKMDRT